MGIVDHIPLARLSRFVLTWQTGFAFLAAIGFWMTIIEPGNILPGEVAGLNPKEQILYTPEILNEAANMDPARIMNSGKADIAIKRAYDLASVRPHDVAANICAGNVLLQAGEEEEGFRKLKRAVALAPRSRYVRMNLADKLAEKGRYQEAIAQYQLICEGFPGWSKPRQALANIYLKIESPADAASELKQVLEIEPNNGRARMLRGIALARAGQGRKGLEEYFMGDAAQQNFEGLPDDLKQLIKVWGALDKAENGAYQELATRPEDAMVKLRLARILMYTGRPREAKLRLLESRKGAPSDPDVHRNLALVLQKLGETNLALSEFTLSANLERAQEQAKTEE